MESEKHHLGGIRKRDEYEVPKRIGDGKGDQGQKHLQISNATLPNDRLLRTRSAGLDRSPFLCQTPYSLKRRIILFPRLSGSRRHNILEQTDGCPQPLFRLEQSHAVDVRVEHI